MNATTYSPKRVWIVLTACIAILLIGVLIWTVSDRSAADHVEVRIADRVYQARTAYTEEEKQRGLSGTASLPADEALLMVYDEEGMHGIWMKDMAYSIDILWLNSFQEVVHVVTHAHPDSYPNMTFTSELPAQYIIEFAAGMVEATGIQVGDTVEFDVQEVAI